MPGHCPPQGVRIEQVDIHECEAAMHDGRGIRHLSHDGRHRMSLGEKKGDGAPTDDARGAAHENLHGLLVLSSRGAMSPFIGSGRSSDTRPKPGWRLFFSI